MNTKTIKNLIIIFALVFLLAGANSALAYVPGVWDYQPSIHNNEPAFYKVPMTYDEPLATQVYTTNNQNTTTSTTKKVVTTTNTTKNTTVNNTDTNDNAARELKPVITTDGSNNNGLTALSLAGSGSFMPSSIWQWLIVIFLILVIIIIARRLGKPHTHEVHTVTAH
jgi:hypothetical protein